MGLRDYNTQRGSLAESGGPWQEGKYKNEAKIHTKVAS